MYIYTHIHHASKNLPNINAFIFPTCRVLSECLSMSNSTSSCQSAVHTDRTSGTRRLNSSKQPQEPLAAKPLKMLPGRQHPAAAAYIVLWMG